MLINPSLHNSLENTIFGFQITINRVHPVQILSRSDYCITTDIMWKNTKSAEKTIESQNRGLVPTKKSRPFPEMQF